MADVLALSSESENGHRPDGVRALDRLAIAIRNWWNGAFGRRAAFREGMSLAFDHAAMVAHDAGHPEIAEKINAANPQRAETPVQCETQPTPVTEGN